MQIKDGGHLYHETNPDNLIVEPWNAFSSLFIALPAIYWGFKTYKNFRQFKFLWFCIPLMLLNGMGSTLFHAFRASVFFLYLDMLPAAILTLGVSLYFWNKVVRNPWLVLGIFLPAFLSRYIGYQFLPYFVAINVSYAIGGTFLFLPILIFIRRHHYHYATDIFISVMSLIVALIFRTIDTMDVIPLPMGTHFLWHIFSGIGGYYLASYLYKIKKDEPAPEDLEDPQRAPATGARFAQGRGDRRAERGENGPAPGTAGLPQGQGRYAFRAKGLKSVSRS